MTPDLPPLHILVADDTQANLKLMEAMLGRLGHKVSTANNGAEAVSRFTELAPDLILMDIMMPVMDGFEAARRIKAESTHWVPLIFLSALERDQNLLAGLEAGGDDYLAKPVNSVILEAKLRSIQKALQFQHEAIATRKRIENLSNSVLDAIITIDSHGVITQCNLATELIFQRTMDELVGQNVSSLMPEPQRSEHDFYLRSYLGGGAPKIVGSRREVTAQRKDGSCFQAELSVSEVRHNGQRFFTGIVRDITEQRRIKDQLDAYYTAMQEEQVLAKRLIEMQLHRPGLQDPLVQYWVAPTTSFSGDVVAAARSPEGRRYALLADATGHGLGAAISVLPVLALFYRMAAQNREVTEIIEELNQQLRESIPNGRFVALGLVCIHPEESQGSIWVGGIPEVLLLDEWGRIEQRFASAHLPLGIVANGDLNTQALNFNWRKGQQIMFYSDGLVEAENADGEAFGKDGLEKTLAHTSPSGRRMSLMRALGSHLSESPAKDDVSLLLLSHS